MHTQHAFTIYNASAGSGKTYTLVKSYLRTLFLSKNPNKFRELLAITFTNKAVGEMKSRIVETLEAFSKYLPSDAESPTMLSDLAKELNLPKEELAARSSRILKTIIHNYAAFDIVTIDALTSRVLRTFARDLDLASNFEISLDVTDLYARAVHNLIEKAGSDKKLTQTLIDFALQKADDDKSWDISKDFIEIAKVLNNENDREAITFLKDKSIADFKQLEKGLSKKKEELLDNVIKQATETLETLHAQGLNKSSFNRGSFYLHLQKLQNDPESIVYDSWRAAVDDHNLYTKSQKQDIKDSIDHLTPELIRVFKETQKAVEAIQFYSTVLKNITPLSVLNLIAQELEAIKDDENILLISDFNNYIYNHLKNEPAPFIYERIGERYSNYFIDEFQDTSTLQWDNLTPLIENKITAIATPDEPKNSVMIVGDPKQSIYRWRGGNAEQFITLSQKRIPFQLPADEVNAQILERNFRSFAEIISFNNAFFKHTAQYLNNQAYANIYVAGNDQQLNHRKGGYVQIDFIEAKTVADADEIYPDLVLRQIRELQAANYSLGDICILTRKKDHGRKLARFLALEGIEVISPDSMLVSNSTIVQGVHNILSLQVQPDNKTYKIAVLEVLAVQLDLKQPHLFYKEHLDLEGADFYKALEAYGFNFNVEAFESLPLYEGLEYVIRAFKFDKQADAFLYAYADAVYHFTTQNYTGLSGFLDYWELHQDRLNVDLPKQQNAVQLMTIHKSKGLEFPVVIFPYADTRFYSHLDHHWYKSDPEVFNDFERLMVPHSSKVTAYDEHIEALYEQKKQEQEFDSVNMFYVATTRAVERLYVLSTYNKPAKTVQSFSDLLVSFLQSQSRWEEGTMSYSYGVAQEKINKVKEGSEILPLPFISSPKEEHTLHYVTKAGFLWDDDRQDAIQYGNLIHTLMEKMVRRDQLDDVVEEGFYEGAFAKADVEKVKNTLSQIVNHEQLKDLFNPENEVFIERSILLHSGAILIPDRVEITPSGQTILLDYKTGVPLESHALQIQGYAAALAEMQFKVAKKLLVYITDTVVVIEA